MLNSRTITIVMICLGCCASAYAADMSSDLIKADLNQINSLKQQLFYDLDRGDITSPTFDPNTEVLIANTQIAIAEYYLAQNDRQNAAISAIIARKILQGVYGNASDPRLETVYSLLVQIYESDVDNAQSGQDVADAEKAKAYRALADHIRAL